MVKMAMLSNVILVFVSVFSLLQVCYATTAPLPLTKILALWHCGPDRCIWAAEPDLSQSKWILDRGDGHPVANVINLAFVNPLALLNKTTDAKTLNGVPRGMTQKVVQFFQDQGIHVIASIGGATYGGFWNTALNSDAGGLAHAAAAMATSLNLNGIEIDYEVDGTGELTQLNTFIRTYRTLVPYQQGDKDAFLTIDLGAGISFLMDLSRASGPWLNSSSPSSPPLLNWAYAMVGAGPWGSIDDASQYWQQHLTPPSWSNIAPMAPSQLVVSLYSEPSAKNCGAYEGTVQQGAVGWIQQKNTRGIAYWSVGCDTSCVVNCTGIATTSKNLLKY